MATEIPSEEEFPAAQPLLNDLPDLPDETFCFYGTVYAHAEHADALEDVYAETTRIAQHEAGLEYYCLARDSKDPTVFHFFERYKGKKAFEAHIGQPVQQKLQADGYIKAVRAVAVKPIEPKEMGMQEIEKKSGLQIQA